MSKLSEVRARPATIHLTSRCDARHLATLAKMWIDMGEIPVSTSELVRLSIETLCEILVTSGKVDFIQTQSDAQQVLGSIGLLGKGLQKRNLVEAIVREGNIDDAISPTFHQPTKQGHITKDDPNFKRAQALLVQELTKSIETHAKEDKDSLNDMLKGLGDIPS